MPSPSPLLRRRVPQQRRGEQRVADLLNAAASVISESGYDSATMCEIAERAGACIGSLYQFFPNKEAVADALRSQYRQDLEMLWASLEEAQSFSPEELASRLILEEIDFLENRPALRELLNLPTAQHDQSIRESLRQRLARILRSCAPVLTKPQAYLYATVSLQLIKALNELYSETSSELARNKLVSEFELTLTCYLRARLGSAISQNRSRRRRQLSTHVPSH